ncbi:MAG: hypothetical protein IVW53_07375 [Chloroflexi bacterium]|nr:hypothetical protein [Chloroflexota bacterium]
MEHRRETEDLPPTTRVKPAMRGRALPLPSLVPLVGALGVLLGFILAPKGVPLPAPSPVAIAAASPSSTDAPRAILEPTAVQSAELPPGGGLPLAQALAAMGGWGIWGMGVSPTAVISARIVRYSDVSSFHVSRNRGVWAIVTRGTFPSISCGGLRPGTPAPCPAPATTELLVLDYHPGFFLESTIPAPP